MKKLLGIFLSLSLLFYALPVSAGAPMYAGVGGQVDSVVGTINQITVTSTDPLNPVVGIATGYLGQASITTLGTIATGSWNADPIGNTKGGTGIDTSSSSGIPSLTAGVWSVGNVALASQVSGFLPPENGGTGISTAGASGLVSINSGQWWFSGAIPSGRIPYMSADNKISSSANLIFDGTNLIQAAGSYYNAVTRTTMTGDDTLTNASNQYQMYDPNGSNRSVTLPTAATGMAFVIHHFGSANTITVKNAAAATVVTLTAGDTASVLYDGTAWQVL